LAFYLTFINYVERNNLPKLDWLRHFFMPFSTSLWAKISITKFATLYKKKKFTIASLRSFYWMRSIRKH
jgi:hypothetical protein